MQVCARQCEKSSTAATKQAGMCPPTTKITHSGNKTSSNVPANNKNQHQQEQKPQF
jgi:hypothetical protein